ncbi:hypothetical protein N0V93_004591 [Gnomoniopsis smithogilvyi]|uniref:Cytochrome P450 n=1 Tax=Gnomoniopsis smithogilvyi TaxID=1191159 RepID=A0A9W9CVZ5_9PEZI|nr:hypothetical protein N0V93_004591 [Gnomoniopsis smithogilvyi]
MTFTIEEHVQQGYTKIMKQTGGPFVMKWWGLDYVFLPPRYLVDLKRSDEKSLSFLENISQAFSLHASAGDIYSSDLMINVVRHGINKRFAKLVPLLHDECNFAFSQEIGDVPDWAPFRASATLSSIMHRTTSRVLAGSDLCRDERFLKTSQVFSESLFINGLLLTMLPLGPFRRTISRIFSVFHRRNLRKAVDVVLPVVQARLEYFQQIDRHSSLQQMDEPLDAIQWSLDLSKYNTKEHNPQNISLLLLHNLWAGSAAPGGLVTQMVFQILLQPHYIDPLRAEACKAFDTYGVTDKALSSMVLMDSFIREINRMYPTGAITCARTVMNQNGIRFHDGMFLDQGKRIALPALAIQMDPEVFEDAMSFDGFRFSKLAANTPPKSNKEAEQDWGAATVSDTNLAFGYGKHACSGRFYAVRKAKLVSAPMINGDI